jgi:hypothetical protein
MDVVGDGARSRRHRGGRRTLSLSIGGVRCQVCMEFHGERACRAVDGNDEKEARSAAVTNACALLASGVTDTVACQNTPPSDVHCDHS